MEFNFTQEQRQFAQSVRRWIEKDYSFERRREIVRSGSGISAQAWSMLAELGMTALPVPEEQGGFNGSAVDMLLVMQELGRGLLVEPYWATMLGAQFLKYDAGKQDLLEKLAGGKLKLACALGERQSRHDLFDIAVTAAAAPDGYVINGMKTVVIHGAQADQLIVSARTGGDRRDTAGISLFLVPADTDGVHKTDYRTIDGMRAADIRFDNAHVPDSALLGSADTGWEMLDAAVDYGVSLLCAEAVGIMEAVNEATLEYLKTRQQFGAPIGKFQVLQHRMVDMFIHLEQARSLSMLAAVKLQSADAQERRRSVSAAKARIGQASKFIGQQAIQLHGGMGVTDELPVSHYFKRLTMIESTLGDTDHHLARFIAQPGFAKTDD